MQQIFHNTRTLDLALSILIAVIVWQGMSFLYTMTPNPVFRIFGGGGVSFLKFLAYASFTFGILELKEKRQFIKREENGFRLDLLPTQDQMVLGALDVQNIKLEVIALEKKGHFYLVSSMVKKTATQFRNDNDISDTMKAFETQLNTDKEQKEGELELVRYILQSIPMLGFIGTIIELTASLQYIAQKNGLNLTRDAMSSAFDTTLVALSLTILLTYLYHAHIGQLDIFYSKVKSYIMDNLIARIYTKS